MADTSFSGWVEQRRADLTRLMESRLATPETGDPGRLIEAMRYSLLAPGKRVRPLLALAAADGGDSPPDDGVVLACASVELVHCYSLIHDDLPAMDDDDFRRGRPSNHKVFGDAIAILAGDALLTLAFDWIAEAGARSRRPADYLRAAGALARGAGMMGMVRGQARDLREPAPTSVADLERLHAEKTGALFRAALEIGGAVAGSPPEVMDRLLRFGAAYGIGFQHADDLDDRDHPGHAAAARQRLQALVAEAAAIVAPLGSRGERLAAFARALLPESRLG